MNNGLARASVIGAALLGGLPLVLACSEADPEREAEGELGSSRQAIWNGQIDTGGPVRDAVVYIEMGGTRPDGKKDICTGTLLTHRVVLTAAHCLVGQKDIENHARCQGTKVFVGPTYPHTDVRRVDACATYWQEDTDGIPGIDPMPPTVEADEQDLALLFLEVPELSAMAQGLIVSDGFGGYLPPSAFGQFWDRTTPATLTGLPNSGTFDAETVGWGTIETLVIPDERRFNVLPDLAYTQPLPGVIHASLPGPYRGIDKGDSGGPLFFLDSAGNRSGVMGVASSGGPADLPENGGTSVWTSVSSPGALAWLAENVADPNRPGKLIGQRDYTGACQPAFDSDCDRWFETPEKCPDFFPAGSQYNPTDLNTLPGLAVYGQSVLSVTALSLNDRSRILQADGNTPGAAVAGPQRFLGPPNLAESGIFMGNDAVVGSLHSMESLFLQHRYQVSSIQVAPGISIFAQDGRNLSGITSYTANVAPLSFPVPATPPLTSQQLVLNAGQQYPSSGAPMPAGTRVGTVIVNQNAVLRLGAGRYHFDNLTVEPGGRLDIDHTEGRTEIYVSTNLNFKGQKNSVGGHQCNTLVGYLGSNVAHVTGDLRGTLVAPNAGIVLNNTPFGAPAVHRGAYYAGHTLTVHQSLTVRHCPLMCE